jgi:site-specific DNA recombinase
MTTAPRDLPSINHNPTISTPPPSSKPSNYTIHKIEPANNPLREDLFATKKNKSKKDTKSVVSSQKVQEKYAVIYTRVSTMYQADNFSLKEQEYECARYCEINNLKIVGIYTDVGISGAILNRPELKRMLREVHPGTTIVVRYLSRLSRDTKDLLELKEIVDKLQVKLHIIDMNVDLDSAHGLMMLTVMGALSTYEKDMISERVRNGMAEAKREGRLLTKAHYGYKIENKQEVENPEEQKVVSFIRELITTEPHISYAEIVRRLANTSFVNRNGNKFSHSSVIEIIRYHELR